MSELVLEVIEGGQSGLQIPLDGEIAIGRDQSMPLALEDDQVSRRHARVYIQGTKAVVEDLGSANGTYVNGQPAAAARLLSPGDRIRVGLTVLELRTSQEVARRPSAVIAVPQVTAVRSAVLRPAAPEELSPPPVVATPTAPKFAVEQSAPAFVPAEVGDDVEAQSNYKALARLLDANVKTQTNTAVFALLGAAGLAVLLVFGLK